MPSAKYKFSTISLPTQLIDKIKEKIEDTGFHSPSAYVAFVLRQILSESTAEEKKETFSKEDEQKIKKRLKSLGYS